jgi:hypothetical protein
LRREFRGCKALAAVEETARRQFNNVVANGYERIAHPWCGNAMILPAWIFAVFGADLASDMNLDAMTFQQADRAFDLAAEFGKQFRPSIFDVTALVVRPELAEFALRTELHITEENGKNPGFG